MSAKFSRGVGSKPILSHLSKEFGIKIFEIDMLMIIDLLTSPQGHQFDPSIKSYYHSVLLVISIDLICHMTMFEFF